MSVRITKRLIRILPVLVVAATTAICFGVIATAASGAVATVRYSKELTTCSQVVSVSSAASLVHVRASEIKLQSGTWGVARTPAPTGDCDYDAYPSGSGGYILPDLSKSLHLLVWLNQPNARSIFHAFEACNMTNLCDWNESNVGQPGFREMTVTAIGVQAVWAGFDGGSSALLVQANSHVVFAIGGQSEQVDVAAARRILGERAFGK